MRLGKALSTGIAEERPSRHEEHAPEQQHVPEPEHTPERREPTTQDRPTGTPAEAPAEAAAAR